MTHASAVAPASWGEEHQQAREDHQISSACDPNQLSQDGHYLQEREGNHTG